MTHSWEPGTQYNGGDVVEYHGSYYKIIQPHRSQSDWTPDVTPALWGRTEHHDGGNHHNDGKHGHDDHHNRDNHYGGGGTNQQSEKRDDNHNEHKQHPFTAPPPEQQVDIHKEEREKNWYDISDERKKQLAIGGGLLAGAAVIAGGYAAYSKHEKNEDQKQAAAWGLQNWLREAESRTSLFKRDGPRGPTTWILARDREIPRDALTTGREGDHDLHIARAFHEGSIQVGKAARSFPKGAVIGYGHKEIHLPVYEILIGDMRALRWVRSRGRVDIEKLGATPVEGGRERDNTPIFVAKAHHKGADHPGKCSQNLNGAFIPYGDDEVEVKEYEILCHS